MATWNITNTAQLSNALANAADGDVLSFAPGDYTGVEINIGDGRGLTFTSANAGIHPSNWAPGSEVIIDRISTMGDLTVNGVHVHATSTGAGFVNGGTWEAIGVGATNVVINVTNSILSIDANGAPGADQGFGFNITYNTDDVTIDNCVIGPFEGGFENDNISDYGIWLNGTANTGRDITITNNTFETGSPRAIGIAFDGQVGGPQVVVTGNEFEDVGTAPGAIRIFDFGVFPLVGPQDYSGITGNTVNGGGAGISNESGNSQITFGGADNVVGTSGDDTFMADVGNDMIDGLGGSDTIDMTAAGSNGSVVILDISGSGVATSSTTGTDVITSIENVNGSSGVDFIVGSDGANTLNGAGGNDIIAGADGEDTIDGGTGNDTLDGGEGDDVMNGGDGDDTLIGGDGNDELDGGDDVDSANYSTSYVAPTVDGDNQVTNTGSVGWDSANEVFTVESGAYTDTLTNVEKAEFSGGKTVWLVDSAADLTAALAGASNGDIIKLAPGEYAGAFNVTVDNLTIESVTGIASDVVLKGTFSTDNPSIGAEDLNEWIYDHNYNGGSNNNGFTINADGVSIKNLTITDYTIGIRLGDNASDTIDDLTIENVDLDSNLQAVHKDVGGVNVDGFTMTGGTISHGYQGIIVAAAVGDGSFNDVTIDGVTFEHLTEKGIYVEQLSNAELTNLEMTDVGQLGRGQNFGPKGQNGAGIDINLKYGDYSNITISDFDFTDVGLSAGEGTPHVNGGAIMIKARDDAPSYNTNDATLENITVENGTIDGTSTGIRVGEPGKTNAGPLEGELTVSNVTITDAAVGSYDNRTTAEQTFELSNGADTVSTNPSSTGPITYVGLNGGDTYTINGDETIVEEAAHTGIDTVISRGSHTLDNNVENLTLADAGTGSEDFEGFGLGAITDNENGWNVDGTTDAQVVTDPADGSNQVMRISSDPTTGHFGGPYSADIGVSAGEPATTAEGEVHVISFRVKPVDALGDNSRLEVDFGNQNGTDRNNFMVIEATAAGIRVAVADPLLNGNFDTGAGINDFSAFTGNRTLIEGIDLNGWVDIKLHLRYVDGANNDVIDVYVNGDYVGTTTTFENYRDALGGTHSTNAEANQTSRILFRGSAGPGGGQAPQDGAGGQNEGFYFDDLTSTVSNNTNGTGNNGNNVINGNAGHNILSGLGGEDTLNGGDGNDTLIGGADADIVNGGDGNDTIIVEAGDADVIDGGNGFDTVEVVGTSANETVNAVYEGSALTGLGGDVQNVEAISLDLGGGNDTLDYTGSTEGVSVNLADGDASGFTSIDGVENVTGGDGADALFGDGNANVLKGGGDADFISGNGGHDTLEGGEGNDILNGGAGDDHIDGGAGGDTISGGADNDTIVAGTGDDEIDGGTGIDVAEYGAGYEIAFEGGQWVVKHTSSGEVDELDNVEQVSIDGQMYHLVDDSGGNGFTTIQAAIDAASAGDTILVAAGTYAEDLNINEAVTIEGAKAGVSGTGGGRSAAAGTGETTIIGNSKITASGDVKIDGVRFLNDATTTNGGPSGPTLQVASGFDHVITNSIFWSTVQGAVNDDRAIMLPPLGGGEITISDNLISGSHQNSFGTASWGRAIWLDGGTVEISITGNTIEWSRTGVNADMGGASEVDISGNTFNGTGTGTSIGVDTNGLTFSDNTYENVGTEFNFRNLTTGIDFDAEEAVLAVTPGTPSTNDVVIVLGGSGADTIDGTSGADFIDGNNHPDFGAGADADVLDGRGGNDTLEGRGGDDTLKGGDGNDTINGGAGSDTAVFDGDWSDYTVTDNGGGSYTVTDGTYTDTLTGVEKVKFGSGTAVNIADALTANGPVLDLIGDFSVAENTLFGTEVADADASDDNIDAGLDDEITFSLRASGGGAFTGPFSINVTTGAILVAGGLDFEGVSSYTFEVVATDAAGNEDFEEVTVTVTGVNELINLPQATFSAEIGSTEAIVGQIATDPNLTFDISLFDAGTGGTVFMNGVALNGTETGLTLAQINSLTWTSGTGSGVIEFAASDGLGNTGTLQLNLAATLVLSTNYTGQDGVDDRLDGAAGDDFIDGLTGADTMIGGIGDDTFVVDNLGDDVIENALGGTDTIRTSITLPALAANVENGLIIGSAARNLTGNDELNTLTGNGAVNVLMGLDGNDTLFGLGGNDTLWGGDNDDLLVGGAGRDFLHGELGADRFDFNSIAESRGRSSSTRDNIQDFSRGQGDKIDLSTIDARSGVSGNQRFTFIGSSDFSEAKGQLRFQHSGSDTLIMGDVNGDGKADFTIVSNVKVAFLQGDFVL